MRKNCLLILSLLACTAMHSQKSKPEIVKREVVTRSGIDIYDELPPIRGSKKTVYPKLTSQVYVYYNNKFYPTDTLRQLQKEKDLRYTIINIPDSISKDLRAIIVVEKQGQKESTTGK